jgi:pyruvate dehydrogenase E1 component alpha subunit
LTTPLAPADAIVDRFSDDDILSSYTGMYQSRRFDAIAVALARQGGISGYAEARGQEGGQIGAAAAIDSRDMIFPSFRQAGVALFRGVPARAILRFHRRLELCNWDWREHRFALYTIPVGSQLAHATGWGLAKKWQGEDAVALTYFGDGASSQGEVHEAMNYAGTFKAPVVFVCENNGWAISMPFERQTAAESIASRAAGYGFEGVRIDSNDVLAIAAATQDAIAKARAGGGPTLIEAVSYRLGAHTTHDDPTLYRDSDEAKARAEHDPIAGLRTIAEDRFGKAFGDRLTEAENGVDAALDKVVEEFLDETKGRST